MVLPTIVAPASTGIAREPSTHEYLAKHGIARVPAADLAFI